MITDAVKKVLNSKEFVYLATSDLNAKPSVAPKFFIKTDKNFIYLVDYVAGRTWENIKANPVAAISFRDSTTLTAYLVRGTAGLITSGTEFDTIMKELLEREASFATERIIEGIRKGKRHSNNEMAFPEKIVVIKIKGMEIVEIGPSGKLRIEKAE